MSKSPTLWTNPLTILLLLLALVWIFAIVKYCSNRNATGTGENTTAQPVSPVPNYQPLPESTCPLKLSQENEALAVALLQQYFRLGELNQFQEAVWEPNPDIDTTFARQYQGNWETYVECIQTLQTDSTGRTEKLALIASNFPDNDCRNCAPYIGYIRFTVRDNDPATMVIRDSDRALFRFGAYGAVGDQISLIDLAPSSQALLFSTAITDRGITRDSTTLYRLEDFHPILTLERYESNGGEASDYLYERRGELYYQANSDPYLPAKLALHERTRILSGNAPNSPEARTTYFEYRPESRQYVRAGGE